MKIIHISDTHGGSGDCSQRFNSIVSAIIKNFNPLEVVVLHTGDIVHSYSEKNSDEALSTLNRLTDLGFKVLLCPGNHDYGNSLFVSTKCAEAFQKKFSKEIFNNRVPLTFPVVTRIEDCVFIGLDTSEKELRFWEQIMAEGEVGSDQRAKLSKELDLAKQQGLKTVVYMHHHPFITGYSVRPDIGDAKLFFRLVQWCTKPFRRLKDAYSLMQVCRDKVDILLFGHQHIGLNHKFEAERYGMKIALDGSSSTAKDMDIDPMRIRVIDTNAMEFQTLFIQHN